MWSVSTATRFTRIGIRCGGGGDGAGAAEGLELHILNDAVVVDLQIHPHDVAALGVAHLAHAVGVLNDPHVVGMGEMLHDLLAVFHCHSCYFPF